MSYKKRITFIESDESPDKIRDEFKNENLVESELWVRTPDSEKLDKLNLKAVLCGCSTVCIAVIEDS